MRNFYSSTKKDENSAWPEPRCDSSPPRKERAFDDDFGVHSVLVVVMLVGVDLRAIDVIGVGKASVASTGGAIISIAWLIA